MNTSSHPKYSVIDLQNMQLDTHVGRAQAREELENGFHVPPEVIGWFFEVIDEHQSIIRDWEKAFIDALLDE